MIKDPIRIQIKSAVGLIIDSVEDKTITNDVQEYQKPDEKLARAVALVAIWDTWEQRVAAIDVTLVTFTAAQTFSRLFLVRL